jgi:lambda family phage tail tape measure protein
MAMNLEAALKITASVVGENNIRRLGNSMQGLEGQIKNTGQAANLLYSSLKGLAAVAVTGGVVALAKGAIDLADDMRDLSQKTGVSIQTLGQFKVAAELSGTTLEGVAKGLNFLNKNMVAAATGTEAAAAAFKTIGVATTDVQGNLRSADQVFLDIADRFATFRDGPEKAALAMKVFGKAGADLIPILNLGSKEIQRFGLNIGADFADKADAFNDQLGLMKAQVTILTVQLASGLLPVFSGFLSILTQGVTQIGEWIEGIQVAYQQNDIFRTSINALTAGLIALATVQVFTAFINGARAAIAITGLLINALKGLSIANLIAGAAGFLKSKPGAIAALVAGLGVGIDAAFNQGKIVTAISGGISGAVNQAFAGLGAMVPNVPKTMIDAVPDISGLEVPGTPKKPKETKKVSAEELRLTRYLVKARVDGDKLLQAEIEYSLAILDIDSQILDVNNKTKQELLAAEKLLQAQLDIGRELGTTIAQDFIKRQELQDNYNQTVEDLKIKAGVITGEELKQVEINRELALLVEKMPGLTDVQIAKLRELIVASQDVKKSFKDSFGDSLREYYQQLSNFGGQVADSIKGAFQGLEDQLTNFVTTGKMNFADLANSIIQDIARIAIRQAIIKPLLGGLGDIFGLSFANGGVFAQNGIQPFARGGIVDKPTLFPFAKGIGLMGEAGPEAILPLRRGANGRLGVESSSEGGSVSVTINVDATGTRAEGDQGRAGQFARAISEAVKNEIVTQKRPGGLLT